jgi:hypothetical protein
VSNPARSNSQQGRRGALQAAHESLADFPAIVAMHEEQTEKAEAERDRWRETAHEMERARNLLYEDNERLREELRIAQFDATVPVRELRERLERLHHLVVSPGDMGREEIRDEGRRIIEEVLSR